MGTLWTLGTRTTMFQSRSRAENSWKNFLRWLSLPAPVSTQRSISHRWMCTLSRQMLPPLCANRHRQRKEWLLWWIWWIAWPPNTRRQLPSLQSTTWLVFSLTRYDQSSFETNRNQDCHKYLPSCFQGHLLPWERGYNILVHPLPSVSRIKWN